MGFTTQTGEFVYECAVSRAIVDLFIVLAVHDEDDEDDDDDDDDDDKVKIKRNSVK